MRRKSSSVWFVMLIMTVALALVASGCSKKQMVKEEAGAKSASEVKKEATKEAPKAMEKPKREAPSVSKAEKPVGEKALKEAKVERKPEAAAKPQAPKPVPLDLSAMRIQFAFDDYSLSAQSKENLEKIAAWMSKNPDVKIQVQGNTCDIGTAEYNLALGDRRANSAKQYLQGLGVSGSRLSTISYGEEKPFVPNTSEANRTQNRRDEFVRQ